VQKWEATKAFILGQAEANKYLGGVGVFKNNDPKHDSYGKYFVVYKKGQTGWEGFASAAKPGIGRTLGDK